ncbi:urea transporter, partial [Myxococcota bacterium]|nr:urea transporter [Myxococcota bacterium]
MDLSQEPTLLRERLAFAVDTVTQSYAQILFARSRIVGLILILATALMPMHLVVGLAAVALSTGIALGIGLRPDLIRSGLFGYNALLLGLAGFHFFQPSAWMFSVLALAVAISVVLTAAVHSALGNTFGLPALTIPFLVVVYGLLGAAPGLGIKFALTLPPLPVLEHTLPVLLEDYLSAFGALFFDPRPLTGALVIAALTLNSRIGLSLTVLGFVVVQGFIGYMPGSADPNLASVLTYNGVLVAYGLGGIFFVPGRAAFFFAIIGAASAVMITLGLRWVLKILGLPVLILPFNLAMIMLLYAMRQRIRDLHPKSVDFISGTPEQNLIYYRTRIARFGARYLVKIRAPFLGRWICTQGEDGEITHKGLWRHALDFEVEGFDGRLYSGEGTRAEDYYCYRLPVLSPA